jgi:hypothetical protein
MREVLAAKAQFREEPIPPAATEPVRGKVAPQGPLRILRVAGPVLRRSKVATTATPHIWDAITGMAPSPSGVGMETTTGFSLVSRVVSISSAWVGAILLADQAKCRVSRIRRRIPNSGGTVTPRPPCLSYRHSWRSAVLTAGCYGRQEAAVPRTGRSARALPND